MADTVNVPCFRYHGVDFAAQLNIEPGSGSDLLTRCPIRNRIYSLSPEERVRQALIRFLLNDADNMRGWRERLRFEVEQRSLDIAIFLTREPDVRFVVNLPILIVETKRFERELMDDVQIEEQLKTYMLRERCRTGLIFNARQAIWLAVSGEFTAGSWRSDRLSDLSELEQRIYQSTQDVIATALDYEKAFRLAASGDFDSLTLLASLIGNDSRYTFFLVVRARGDLSSIQAFGVRIFDGDNISYRARGVVSRNRRQLARQDFHSLLALRPLG